MLHNSSLNQSQIGSSNNDGYDYIAEKLQFLLKHFKSLVNKETFEEEK